MEQVQFLHVEAKRVITQIDEDMGGGWICAIFLQENAPDGVRQLGMATFHSGEGELWKITGALEALKRETTVMLEAIRNVTGSQVAGNGG